MTRRLLNDNRKWNHYFCPARLGAYERVYHIYLLHNHTIHNKSKKKKRLDQVGLKAESACQHSQQVREHPVVPARRAACVYECVKENKTKSGQAAARKKGFIKSSRVRYFSRLSASRSL